MWWMLWACTGQLKDTGEEVEHCDISSDAFAVLPDSPLTQIHADVASDGQRIWMVYNLPNEQGDFDVYLTAIDCDGSLGWGPEQVLDIEGLNQTTPRVAVSGDRVLVAVQADSGVGPNNLSISLHLQTVEGELIYEGLWETELSNGNAWLPSVVGSDDGFWMAAAVAHDTYFRTAVQALDFDGMPRAPAHWVGPEAYAVFPNIDVREGQYIVGWENGEDAIQYGYGDTEGMDGEVTTMANHASVRVLWENDAAHVYSHQRSPLQVQRDGVPLSGLSNTLFPNAAHGVHTNLFVHYRLQSGYKNDVYYGAIHSNGDVSSDILLTSDPPAAPYRPAVTHFFDDVYFVAWSQGQNPDFSIQGQFIVLD